LLLHHFSELTDDREPLRIVYPLAEVLLLVVCATIAGCDDPVRVFRDFRYRTRYSWSQERRVVGKAEHTRDGANPRFVVTSFDRSRHDARSLYEDLYCARGEAENRIGEQFELLADRAPRPQ